MFIACTGYLSYGVLSWILLHSVKADANDKAHPVCYNEGLMYLKKFYTMANESNLHPHIIFL
jgi:hypothetical protein